MRRGGGRGHPTLAHPAPAHPAPAGSPGPRAVRVGRGASRATAGPVECMEEAGGGALAVEVCAAYARWIVRVRREEKLGAMTKWAVGEW